MTCVEGFISGQDRVSCKQESNFSNFHRGMSSCHPTFHGGSHEKGLLMLFAVCMPYNFTDILINFRIAAFQLFLKEFVENFEKISKSS